MKKSIVTLCITAVLAFVLAVLFNSTSRKVRAQLYPLKSFQVWRTEKTSWGSPLDTYYARRSNGDSVEHAVTDGVREFHLASQGLTVVTTSKNNNRMTYGKGTPLTVKDFDESCSVEGGSPTSERKVIFGQPAVHITYARELTAKSGSTNAQREDRWVSPSLNCYPLEERISYLTNGIETAWQSTTATSVILGEPPENVFNIPDGLVEQPPSVFWPAINRQFNPRNEDAYQKDKAARGSLSSLLP